jgi:hypothetical protein
MMMRLGCGLALDNWIRASILLVKSAAGLTASG